MEWIRSSPAISDLFSKLVQGLLNFLKVLVSHARDMISLQNRILVYCGTDLLFDRLNFNLESKALASLKLAVKPRAIFLCPLICEYPEPP
jgi:hypothetical protein